MEDKPKYKSLRPTAMTNYYIDHLCNDMFAEGYRLHSVFTEPIVCFLFEAMDVIAEPIATLNRRLETL